MKITRLAKIWVVGFILAVGVRLVDMGVETYRQDALTKDLCGLVSLPLETGLLRETHEGLEGALKARGESSACVSVTDNGRSYSPNCIQASKSYRTVECKAEGNTGVRAAISYESRGPFDLVLIYFWAGVSVLLLLLAGLSRLLTRHVASVFSDEVSTLLHRDDSSPMTHRPPTLATRLIRSILNKVGLSNQLSSQTQFFKAQLMEFEQRIASEAATRSRLEQESVSSKEYVEKVKQIRHDIRSPLSSLQSIYEKVKTDDGTTTKALANAIRRIQVLMDDLNQVDRVVEMPTLVIAEVAIEDIALLMTEKFKETKSATLSIEYSRDSLSPIMVGQKDFSSAIENLLENALEAIGVGGHVQVGITSAAGLCKITVEDDGCGIPSDVLPKLFKHGGSFGKLNGLGLGLYHTKRNVESWGGTIECMPLSRGTRFVISLPMLQTGVVFSGLPQSRRLKVIDDDHMIPNILKQAGFEVLEFADSVDGGEAILSKGAGDGTSILVDQRIGKDHLGTDLIAAHSSRKNVFLCTNDFDDLELIKLARAMGVKIIPKPLCYFESHRHERIRDDCALNTAGRSGAFI